MQRLNQIVAGRGHKPTLRSGRRLGKGARGFECGIGAGQRAGAFLDAGLQRFLILGQHLFGALELGNVGQRHQIVATRQRPPGKRDHPLIIAQTQGGLLLQWRGAALCGAPQVIGFAGTRTMAKIHKHRQGRADMHRARIKPHEGQERRVPRDDQRGLVDHADALRQAFERGLQQFAAEMHRIARFIQNPSDRIGIVFVRGNRDGHHVARRWRTDHACQHALGGTHHLRADRGSIAIGAAARIAGDVGQRA